MSTFTRASSRAACISALVLCSFLANQASADSSDLRKADQLFRDGKQRLADEDYAHACPLLAESYRLDPATGTLLALAICHERDGKLGSAFREYNEVIARCKNEARPDREQAARERANALEARLSTLTLKAADPNDSTELEVTVNGARIARARLGKPLAVDGGAQTIEVSAQGKKPWRTELRVAKAFDARTVVIPQLDSVSAPVTSASLEPARTNPEPTPPVMPAQAAPMAPVYAAAPMLPPPPPPQRQTDDAGLSATQWVGLGAMGTGLIALGTGTYFAARAISWNRDSNKGCIGNACNPTARQSRLDANSAGNAATVAFIVGGALAATGVTMFLLGQRSTPSPAMARAAISASPFATPHELGGSLHGTF